jgi:hypothetical protein
VAPLQTLNDIHLVLNGVPDVEVMIARDVDDLPRYTVVAQPSKEASGITISVGITRYGKINDVAEENQVVDLSDCLYQGFVRGAN